MLIKLKKSDFDLFVVNVGMEKVYVTIDEDIEREIDVSIYEKVSHLGESRVRSMLKEKGIQPELVKVAPLTHPKRKTPLKEVSLYALRLATLDEANEYFERYSRLRSCEEAFTIKDRTMNALNRYLKRVAQ